MWNWKLVIAPALCLIIASAVLAQSDKWNELNHKVAKLSKQGKYTEANEIAEKALEVAENTFGPDHPNTAASLNNLAELYRVQGRYAEAEPLYKRALPIYVKALGADHPTVAKVLGNLLQMKKQMGNKPEASECEECPQRIEPQKPNR
jgi:tetratricopeptide (TPR) repeat protein